MGLKLTMQLSNLFCGAGCVKYKQRNSKINKLLLLVHLVFNLINNNINKNIEQTNIWWQRFCCWHGLNKLCL